MYDYLRESDRVVAGSMVQQTSMIDPAGDEDMDVPETLRAVALKAYQNNLPDICKETLEYLAGIVPDDPGLRILELCQSAHRHSLDGRHYEAVEILKQALTLDPTSQMATFRLVQATGFAGERLARDGNIAEGLPFLDVALTLSPEDETLRNVTINCLMTQAIEKLARGEIEQALTDYRRGASLAGFQLGPLKAINFCITQTVRQETAMQYRFVLLSLLHNHDLSGDAVGGIRMGAGALRNVAAQCGKGGEWILEGAALQLQQRIWGLNDGAAARLLELNQTITKNTSILRQELFHSDRNTICYSPFVGHHGRPNGNYGTTLQFLDRDGFPNTSVPAMPKPEARRVFVLGDSTIYNGDGSLETTIPARMQNMLHAQGETNVRIYNYSIPGCTFHQPLVTLPHGANPV